MNAFSLITRRAYCPPIIPASAGTSASTDTPRSTVCSAPVTRSCSASATVDAVNDNPSAWIRSSFGRRNACRYGTAGTTNTPVAAVTTPVR
ncbi:hypothetical protein WT49_22405 [Burkholderia territorii]|nr:hypothetical protein WT49_22405 [Burkholderia territorii]KWE47920.1 hypothetical protein WT50_06450 [Burkholderia territorii]KWE51938.1 hypothetical protein WT51_10750 [Burkholderia territorii]